MLQYLKNMEQNLSDDQKDMLKRIYEPTVVAVPLWDSRRDICILPDGEIRSYGELYEKGKKEYEKMYGPLSLTSAAEGERYAWMQDPWPWEYAANCRKEG